MKHIILKGGLGNQIFQYSFSKYLENRGFEVCLDSKSMLSTGQANKYLDKIFYDVRIIGNRLNTKNGVDNSILFKILRIIKTIFYKQKIYEENISHKISSGEIVQFKTFNGYWQNTEYLKNININLNPLNKSYDSIIPRKKNDIVAIHVRLGDYTKLKNQSIHGLMSKSFYEKGILQFLNEKKIKKVIVFSDSPTEAYKLIKSILSENNLLNEIILEGFKNKGYYDFEEMHIMSLFENIIISNSTFSYWAAILGKSNKSVIAPNKWYENNEMQRTLAPRLKQNSWIYL